MTRRHSWAGGAPGASRLPRWFIDGMAEYLSHGPVDPDTAMWVRDAVARTALPDLSDLGRRAFSPSRWGEAFWAYVAGRWGDEVVGDLLRTAAASGDVRGALERELNLTPGHLVADWQQALRAQEEPILQATEPVGAYRRLLVEPDGAEPGLSVSPSISPDGRRFVYLSRRSPLSVDLYLGDATTGKRLRRLTSLSLDPRISSRESAASAGSWAPDNRHVVLADVQHGEPELVIIDIDRNRVEERIPFPSLGSILGPAWSPDGGTIAFAAMADGVSNLYLYTLADRRLRRLTHDPFGAVEPAWSPDGRTIAFVTDRGSSRLEDLDFGRYELALVDVATSRVTPLPTFAAGKSIDPQWSADGRSVLFVSDRDGVSNVYRVQLAGGRLTQLTDLQTGVTGLTPLSAAISVAWQQPRLLFSAFQEGGNVVLRLDGAAALAGRTPDGRVARLEAGRLPPR
ncbi:MAG: PD40 domain-containing protein, partial [Acidobacteriota bacterium]|nr:PD40 domain-containing protein [Acidobacteriota bacterium]